MLGEVTPTLYEFLVAYMHAVAYIARVYPDSSFALVRQYGAATYENRHPGVRQWVETAAQAVLRLLLPANGSLPREGRARAIVSIAVLENGEPIERFGVEAGEFAAGEAGAVSETELVEQYRGCLVKLLHASRLPVPSGDRALTLFFEGPVDANQEHSEWIRATGHAPNTSVVPIRSVRIGEPAGDTVLVLNTWRQSR